MAKVVKRILPMVGQVVGFAYGGPAGAALGGALGGAATGGGVKAAIRGGVMGGIGGGFAKMSGVVELDSLLKGVRSLAPVKKEENATAAEQAYSKVVQ